MISLVVLVCASCVGCAGAEGTSSGGQDTAAPTGDTTAPPADDAAAPTPSDALADAGAPPPEDAAPPPLDSPTPPPDSGPPPQDIGPPPQDAEPKDTAPPPQDAGPPPQDAGPPPQDAGPPTEDTSKPPPDTGPPPPGSEFNGGWIGGACTSAASCSSQDFSAAPTCEEAGFPGGYCTQPCAQSTTTGAWICPDTDYSASTPYTITRCITADGAPTCAAECDLAKSPSGCRPGYACVLRQRHGQPDKTFPVCLPDPAQVWPGESSPPNDIGEACDKDQNCGHLSCMKLTGGYCTKTMCDLAGCPSGSSCFTFETSDIAACLQDCTADWQCRTDEGYVCDQDYGVCWPGLDQPLWDPSVGAADCAEAWAAGLHPCDTTPDDFVVLNKSARNLALCNGPSAVDNFNMGLGFSPSGDKQVEGDGKTPEGVFYVAKLLPNSSYYKAFLLSYPDSTDAAWGIAQGLITASQQSQIDSAQSACGAPPQTTNLGGLIEIHGFGGGEDWTWGCAAIANAEIDTLWAALGKRDTIVVKP